MTPGEDEIDRDDGRTADRPGPDQQEESQPGEWTLVGRDVLTSVLAVALIGVFLFAISGVWPPMVAIESPSMEPNMNENDLVFVMDSDRFQPEAAHGETGVVTYEDGMEADYAKYGKAGDVIVYAPDGNTEVTPIIHRAMFWVEAGDNWVEQADESYLAGADTCGDIDTCPAPNEGFITKGDRNQVYDQVQGDAPVKPEWVVGTAEARIPGLGWLRLQFQ